MFAQTHPTHRLLLLPGPISLAVLVMAAVPAVAQDITPERALLNVVPAPYSVVVALERLPIDGARALLGRSPVGVADALPVATGWQEESPAIDGERALRGIVPQSARRPLTLAW